MNIANRNTLWASIVAEELYRSGVRTVCASPGSRSTPLVMALAELSTKHSQAGQPDGLEVLVHIDERSAGFFCLGLAKARSAPVALLCTSGTAAANYYPAVIEAFYSGVPLVVLTADRPPELRDCGSGQTIDQIKLYGDRVRYFFEVGTPAVSGFRLRYLRSLIGYAVAVATGKASLPSGPVHLNFAFADPLPPIPVAGDVPEDLHTAQPLAWYGRATGAYTQTIAGDRILNAEAIATIANQIVSCPKGILVVGVYQAPPGFPEAVHRLARATGYPLLAESTGLDRKGAIGSYDSFLRSPQFCRLHQSELVIRFGAMPTSRSYQQWLERHIQTEQIAVGDGTNNDPTHGCTQFINANSVSFCAQLADYLENYTLPTWQDKNWRLAFEQAESLTIDTIAGFIATVDTFFEGKVFAELGKWLPSDTHLYVASSMPIRDLDTFFHSQEHIPVLANRGANGIDGTLSSALGAAWGYAQPTILVCGDLAFYHDLNGLMAVKKYRINLTIVLLNNDGGGIFEFLPVADFDRTFEQFFATPHGLDFAPIVTAYGCNYTLIQDWQHFQRAVLDSLHQPGTQVLEIRSDRDRNKRLHQQLWQTITQAVDKHFQPAS